MDFADQIRQLGERAVKLRDHLLTEEATKHAIVMPFLGCLGYDVFDPTEVNPEYISDVGIKKGEKIDYAILRDGVPEILIECKHHKEDLLRHDEQLRRYFHASPARFGILTNGYEYRFYTDLVDANKMDENPFLKVDITAMKPAMVEGLFKFTKQNFSRDSIFDAVRVLKHSGEIKMLFQQQLSNPSEDFVKVFASKVYAGNLTTRILQQFTDLTRISVNQYISELVNERSGTILAEKESESQAAKISESEKLQEATPVASAIVTTQEELEGFYIVKNILREIIDPKRIFYRDAVSYFAILLDDNNRKPICRLYFNGPKMSISTFDASKLETKLLINTLDDIYGHAQALRDVVAHYLSPQTIQQATTA